MKLREYAFSKGDGEVLLDIGGVNGSLVWVIDGATPLVEANHWSTVSDTYWLVQQLHEELLQLSEVEKSQRLDKLILDVLAKVRGKLSTTELPVLEDPSFAMSLVKIHSEKIEYIVIGDCFLVLQSNDDVASITDTVFDDFKAKYQTETLQTKKAQVEELIEKRKLKNSDNGYLIGSIDGYAFEKTKSKTLRKKNIKSAILCTDGFSRLVNDYHERTWEDIFSCSLTDSVHVIRSIEKRDKDKKKYPRIKCSDDIWSIKLSL